MGFTGSGGTKVCLQDLTIVVSGEDSRAAAPQFPPNSTCPCAVRGCPWDLTTVVSGEDGRATAPQFPPNLSLCSESCSWTPLITKNLKKLLKSTEPLHIQKKKMCKIIWAWSMHFRADGRVMTALSHDWNDPCLKQMGAGANLFSLVFQAYLGQTDTGDSINVFWMFLPSTWQQPAIQKAKV